MKAPLTYAPAYFGLFAALWLAMLCNSFLDIAYGRFTFDAFFWAAIHGWTLRVGWLQRGEKSKSGQRKMKIVLVIGLIMFVVYFLPIWGPARGGLYFLGMLQAALNCVATSRRELHIGLLVSAVMVMFSASHYRADWTMLFYLLPYIVAVVFTLVSEQISRHAERVRENSLTNTRRTGQGIAIASATAIILTLTGLLYMLTPQLHWHSISSKYGQLSNLGGFGDTTENDQGGQGGDLPGDQAGGGGSSSQQGRGSGGQGTGDQFSGSGWPTPEQMREAAGRPGMPQWQASVIHGLADMNEALSDALHPIAQAMSDLLEDLKDWLKENREAIVNFLLALVALMLLIALLMLLKEAKAGTWIRTRLDHLYLVSMGQHAAGNAGILQFYRAMERLFLLAGSPRSELANTREFLKEATYFRHELRPAATEITLMFERYRYGKGTPTAADLARMKQCYHQLYRLQQK